jgi:hypothetical protein
LRLLIPVGTASPESCRISVLFFPYSHFLIFITLSVTSPCVVQGAKLRAGPLKICKPASRPTGFGENFSIRPVGRLKIFHQKPCIFSPRPYLPPETSKVKPPTRHKKKVNVMKKRTEIQQDLKRGFGSAPTGIKKWVKWSLVGFVVYVAVRFVCAFVGGVAVGLGGLLPSLAVLAVVVFLIRAVWRILSAFLSFCVLALFILILCVIL